MPGHGVASSACFLQGGGDSPLLWLVDFSTIALGAGTMPDADLTFTRASGGGSVQTSASTVVASGLTNDVARFGSDGTARGLVLEVSRTNLLTYSRAIGNTSIWNGGTITLSYASGPDGAGAPRVQVASGGTHAESGLGAAGAQVGTIWALAVGAAQVSGLNLFRGSDSVRAFDNTSVSTSAWTRIGAQNTGSSGFLLIPFDGRDWTGSGGVAAGARDFVADLAQREYGAFPSEVIVTTGATATRAGERLRLTNASKLVSGGRIEVEFDLFAKGAATEYVGDGAYSHWLSTDASNYVRFDNTTRRFEVVVAGASWSPATAASFTRASRVKVRVRAGGGVLQSAVEYSVNGGAYVSLGTSGAPQGTWPSSATDILSNGTSSQLSCWLASARAYKAGRMP